MGSSMRQHGWNSRTTDTADFIKMKLLKPWMIELLQKEVRCISILLSELDTTSLDAGCCIPTNDINDTGDDKKFSLVKIE